MPRLALPTIERVLLLLGVLAGAARAAPCAPGSYGAVSCTACTGAGYSYGGAAAGCATCPAAAASLVSAAQGCAPLAGSVAGPTDSLALYLSGGSAEGIAAFGVTNQGGLSYGTSHTSGASGALSSLNGLSALATPQMPQLPSASASRSLTAWVKCSPPSSAGGATLLELNGAAAANERFTLSGLPATAAAAMVAPTWTSALVAGTGVLGAANGASTSATFGKLIHAVPDATGASIYVTDQGQFLVRKVSGGVVSTAAGTGVTGFAEGVGTNAAFSTLWGLALDQSGANLFISDAGNNRIRVMSLSTQNVTTWAGTGVAGWVDGPIASAAFKGQTFLALDPAFQAMYVADSGGFRIRKINMTTLVVSTLAGSGVTGNADGVGTAASFTSSRQLAVDPTSAFLYVNDFGACRLKRITLATGVVSWFAGSGTCTNTDGVGTAAQFNGNDGLAIDATGNLYTTMYSAGQIRRVTPAGVSQSIAGSGVSGYAEGTGAASSWVTPLGLAWLNASQTTLIVSDGTGNRLRTLTVSSAGRVSAAAPVCDGLRWHSLALTYTNTSGGVLQLFVDGVSVASRGASVNTADGTSAAISVAGSPFSAEGLTGLIDDVRVYSRALLASEVAAIANPVMLSFPNTVVVPPLGTAGATSFAWVCAPGYAGPTVSTKIRNADYSWSATGGTNLCAICPAGTYSPGGVPSCLPCPAGSATSAAGAASCTQCAPGTVSALAVQSASCSACSASTVSYGGGSVLCAPCPPGAAFVSASSSCVPAAAVTAGPTDTAFYFSGTQAEGVSGFAKSQSAGMGFASGPLSASGGAVTLALGSTLSTAPLSQLPTGFGDKAVSAWVMCAAPLTAAGRTIVTLWNGGNASASPNPALNERLSLLGLPASAAAIISAPTYSSSLLAGSVSAAVGAADGAATTVATFAKINHAIYDGSGTLWIADNGNSNVRTLAGGIVTTVIGCGSASFLNGVGTSACLSGPWGLAFDPAFATLYIADNGNHRIRALSIATNTVSTFVGTGTAAFLDGVGVAASLSSPTFIVIAPGGATMYIADSSNNRIRAVNMVTAQVTTLAGSGTSATVNGIGVAASFSGIRGLAIDSTATLLFVAEFGAHYVRKIVLASATVTTYAGNGNAVTTDGQGTSASINGPDGLVIDTAGNLIVSACEYHKPARAPLLTATAPPPPSPPPPSTHHQCTP